MSEERLGRIESKLDQLVERVGEVATGVRVLNEKVDSLHRELTVKLENISENYAKSVDMQSARTDLKWIKWLLVAVVVAFLGAFFRFLLLGTSPLGG